MKKTGRNNIRHYMSVGIFALCFAMLIGILPLTAFATTEETDDENTNITVNDDISIDEDGPAPEDEGDFEEQPGGDSSASEDEADSEEQPGNGEASFDDDNNDDVSANLANSGKDIIAAAENSLPAGNFVIPHGFDIPVAQDIDLGFEVRSFAQLETAVSTGQSLITIMQDIEIPSTVTIPVKKTITIQGLTGGEILYYTGNKRHFNVGGALTLENIILDASTRNETYGGGLYIASGASLNLNSGSIIQNCNAQTYGGAVFMAENSVGFLNDGAIIQLCEADTLGGGLFIDTKANFTINKGGTVQNCQANRAGGIFSSGNLTIEGGTIANNIALDEAGGVFTGNSCIFTMTGGLITKNKALGKYSHGGGIFSSSYNFNLSGGTISYNSSNGRGGGVVVRNSGSMNMSGGNIINNTSGEGGGLCFYANSGDCTFTMTGGTIKDNTALVDGGGIRMVGSDYYWLNLILEGGEINGNKADNGFGGGIYSTYGRTKVLVKGDFSISENSAKNGGGVYIATGVLNMDGGYITDNTATNEGGGCYLVGLTPNTTAVLKDGVISGNSAKTGGGIYIGSSVTPHILQNITMKNNSATANGGAINAQDYSKLTVESAEFSGNTAGNGFCALKDGNSTYNTYKAQVNQDGLKSLSNPADINSADAYMSRAYNNFDINYYTYTSLYRLVTYNYLDGTTEQQYALYQGLIPKPNKNTCEAGYTLLGWFKDSINGSLWDFDEDKMPFANVNLYERQTPTPFTVYFYDRDYTESEYLQIVSPVHAGDYIQKLEPSSTWTGYKFVEWRVKGSGKAWDFNNDKLPAADLKLVGYWEKVNTPTPEPTPEPTPTPVITEPAATPTPERTPGPGRPTVTPTVSPSPSPGPGETPDTSPEPEATPQLPDDSPAPTDSNPASPGPGGTGGAENRDGGGDGSQAAGGGSGINPSNSTVNLFGNDVPLGGIIGGNGGWSLFNLMLGILSIIGSIWVLISTSLDKKKSNRAYHSSVDSSEDDEFLSPPDKAHFAGSTESKPQKLSRIFAIVIGFLPLTLFFVLENLTAVQIFSMWTPLISVVFLLHLTIVIISKTSGKIRKATDRKI